MRHNTSLPRRTAALFLAFLLLLPTAYATAGERKLQTTTEIVDGLTYRNTVTSNNGSRVESFALELSPDSAAKPILLQGSGTIYAGASINKAVASAQEMGYHVLGAINTDFFSMSTGVPIGIVVEDGVYKSSTDGENAMTIGDGGISVIDAPAVAMSLYNRTTGATVIPNNFNKSRHKIGGVYLLNEDFSTVSTRSDGSGWYVRMRAVPDAFTGQVPDLTVNSSLTLEVTELLLSDQSLVLGPDEYILTAADESNRLDAFQAFQVGDLVTLTTACSNPTLSAAQWAGGVGDIMVRDGRLTDSAGWTYAKDGRQPRSAMGIRPDGTAVFYAVDGRQSGYSVGLSQLHLAEELLSQGCTTAVNLDGGGSTSFSLWVPGTNGPVMLNKSSDGRARSCATYLLLVAEERGSSVPRRLAPQENGQVVLSGSSLTLPQAVAVDEVLNPVSADLRALSYTSLDGLGIVLNGVYTAGWQSGTDELRLTAGRLEGRAQVHVVNQLTEFAVTRSGSSTPLSSLSVKPGEQIQLAASGKYWNRTALRDFAPVDVNIQGNVGTVDSSGLFTAAQDLGSGGTITFSAGGLSQTVQVSASYVHNDVQPGHWAYDAVEYCYEKGVCSGVSATQFGPDNSMIRGDFMLMLYNAAGKPAVSAPCTFTDVSETDYYYTALSWAQSRGLASGTGDGKFSPRDKITREQAFSLLHRYLSIIGKNCPDGDLSVLDQFTDKAKVADYAKTAAATLVAQGLASGSGGELDPRGTLTRAQMASLLYRVLEHTPIQTDPAVPEQPVTPGNYALALDQSQVTLASGGSVTLHASILPAVQGASVVWTSSSPDDVVVSSSGMVTNLYAGKGSASFTVTASWNGLASSCTVLCHEAQYTGTVVNTDTGLNVRSGPGSTYDRVGGLKPAARVVVLSKQEGWYQVLFRNSDGQAAIGYVSADYLVLNE